MVYALGTSFKAIPNGLGVYSWGNFGEGVFESLLFRKLSIYFLDLLGDTIRNGAFFSLSSVSFNDAILTFISMLLLAPEWITRQVRERSLSSL